MVGGWWVVVSGWWLLKCIYTQRFLVRSCILAAPTIAHRARLDNITSSGPTAMAKVNAADDDAAALVETKLFFCRQQRAECGLCAMNNAVGEAAFIMEHMENAVRMLVDESIACALAVGATGGDRAGCHMNGSGWFLRKLSRVLCRSMGGGALIKYLSCSRNSAQVFCASQ